MNSVLLSGYGGRGAAGRLFRCLWGSLLRVRGCFPSFMTKWIQCHAERRAAGGHSSQGVVGQSLIERPRSITAIVSNVEFTFGAAFPNCKGDFGQQIDGIQKADDVSLGFSGVAVILAQDVPEAGAIVRSLDDVGVEVERVQLRDKRGGVDVADEIEVCVEVLNDGFVWHEFGRPTGAQLPSLVATSDRPCMEVSLPDVEVWSKVQGELGRRRTG